MNNITLPLVDCQDAKRFLFSKRSTWMVQKEEGVRSKETSESNKKLKATKKELSIDGNAIKDVISIRIKCWLKKRGEVSSLRVYVGKLG